MKNHVASLGVALGFAAILGSLPAPLTGCGPGDHGACVTHNPAFPSTDDACYDGKSQSDCNGFATGGDTVSFHGGSTCSSLGFTLTCSGEDFHRLPAYAPCP